MKQKLSIDIETYSPTNLLTSGVYKYAEDPEFEIMLLAYAFDDMDVQLVDLARGDEMPYKLMEALTDPEITKTAFNAAFEITCIEAFFGIVLSHDQWECTMIKSVMCGYPMSLAQVAEVMNLEQQKMSIGRTLIRTFSMPVKPTRANGMRTRNLYHHDPLRWDLFRDYCIQDVETERAIANNLSFFVMPESEKELWQLDQLINSQGVLIDMDLVAKAIEFDNSNKEALTAKAKELTGLANPNSVAQLKKWISDQAGIQVDSLNKDVIKDIREEADCSKVNKVLDLRAKMSKTSTKKYEAMRDAAGADNRARGLLQFYGASRTGRWAGRLIQVQNLPRNYLPDLDDARNLVLSGDMELVAMLYGDVADTLSQLIRTAFIAPKGNRFIVADFSAIEARVIAWLAREKWRMDVFASHGKIYEASASQMFGVPIDEVDSKLRQKGKIAELALGYQGGVGALKAMGGEAMGLSESDMSDIVASWRSANQHIVRLWNDLGELALRAVDENIRLQHRGITFHVANNILHITLPSGRALCYANPHITENRWGSKSLGYQGLNQTTRKWENQETYGGKLVENIVQAIARDCLAISMLRLSKRGFKIVMHIHDEVVIEEEIDHYITVKDVCDIMGEPIEWADGLLLTATGFETNYYIKD